MTAPPPFFTRYGLSRPDPSAKSLAIEPYPEICTAGALRATIVASAIDLVGGMYTREIAGVDATFTSDLSLRIARPGVPDRIVARGGRLRAADRPAGLRLRALRRRHARLGPLGFKEKLFFQ